LRGLFAQDPFSSTTESEAIALLLLQAEGPTLRERMIVTFLRDASRLVMLAAGKWMPCVILGVCAAPVRRHCAIPALSVSIFHKKQNCSLRAGAFSKSRTTSAWTAWATSASLV
jgi:hypothetical protein